jgi:excisionase family DNA binding protein
MKSIKLLGGEVELFNVDDLATLLKCNRETVRRYVRSGRLRGVKIGKRIFVSKDNLRDFANGSETPRPEK